MAAIEVTGELFGVTGSPAAAINTVGPSPGTAAAYARASDGTLYGTGQAETGDGWTAWQQIGAVPPLGGLLGRPVVATETAGPDAGASSVFAPGAGTGAGALFVSRQTPPGRGWSEWEQIGGNAPGVSGSPAVVVHTTGPDAGALSAYVGNAGGLYATSQTAPGGTWGPWERIAGPLNSGQFSQGVSSPALVESTTGPVAGILSAFASAEGGVYTTRQTRVGGDWADWQRIGGRLGVLSPPAAVLRTVGPDSATLSVFATGSDGTLYAAYQTTPGGTWTDWQRISGGTPAGGIVDKPTVVLQTVGSEAGTIAAFARAVDGNLYTTWRSDVSGEWAPWQPIGGPAPAGGLTDTPAVVEQTVGPTAGTLSAFARALDGKLYTTGHTTIGGGWAEWQPIGGPPPAGP
jgi:hypothetical protein